MLARQVACVGSGGAKHGQTVVQTTSAALVAQRSVSSSTNSTDELYQVLGEIRPVCCRESLCMCVFVCACLPISHSLTHSHTHTLLHSHTHTRAHSLTLTHPHTLCLSALRILILISHHACLARAHPARRWNGMNTVDAVQRSSVTNKLWRARTGLLNANAHKPAQVLTKTMQDSYTEVHLDFTKDKMLQEEYLTYAGSIRVGKILEDLDALAGTIAYRHCDDNDSTTVPLTIVTASVDRITLLRRFPPNKSVASHTHDTRLLPPCFFFFLFPARRYLPGCPCHEGACT